MFCDQLYEEAPYVIIKSIEKKTYIENPKLKCK